MKSEKGPNGRRSAGSGFQGTFTTAAGIRIAFDTQVLYHNMRRALSKELIAAGFSGGRKQIGNYYVEGDPRKPESLVIETA